MPSADQVPINIPHSTMLGGSWVVLIAGSTVSALRAVRPPNLHITPGVRRDLVHRASATGFVALALGHHGPGHPRNLVRKCDGGDLRRAPPQQRREPGPMLRAVNLGVAGLSVR